MKHKVVVNAGSNSFEFEGQILEIEEDYLILKAKHGDVYIERKFLVFIQFLDEEVEVKEAPEKQTPKPVAVRSPKVDHAARFLKQKLQEDPLEQRLAQKLIPPSQFPDDEEYIQPTTYQFQDEVDEDLEAVKNVLGAVRGVDNPITKAANLKQAIKAAMDNDDFSMGGVGSIEYKDPLQTIMGMKNANRKKATSS